MVNYTSSASLGGGRFSPSVQYNTSVRMPTQPMPEMPDVNSTFNIDLRPVGQALLGVEELKTKTKLAEKEMDLKQELAVQERLHNMAIKRAEWEMKERHHSDDITLGYAKLAAKEQQDSKKTIELNNAVTQYYKDLDMFEAELQQNKIDYTGYEAEKRRSFDRITSHLQYNTIGSFSDAVNSGRPGAGNIKSAYMRDFDKNAEEARNNAATTEANTIANVSNTLGVSTEEATMKVKNTEQAYLSASKYLENATTPPSIVRDDMKDEYIKSQLQAADRELGIVGGAKVIYDFNKHINEIHRMSNPAEGVEMLRQSFYQSMSGLNVPAARVENLWNIYKNQNNLTKLVENVSGLNKNISDNQKLFINRAIDSGKLSLINDPFMGKFYITMEAFPTLSKAFANDPSKFSEITDLSNALINASMVKAEPKEDGWKVTLTDGSVINLDKGTVEPLLTEAGTDDVRSALIYSSLRTAWTARNKGDFATSSEIGSNVVTNIRKERATSSQDNMNKMENMNTALNTMDTRYLGDQDENKVLKSAQAKLLSRYGKGGFIDISGKINYMVPDTVWKNSLKGGKIFIFPKTDGTVGIHREQYGFFGGAGRRSFKDKSKEVSKMMANAGLTPEEQITVFRAVLNDDTNMLEIKEKDWEPSLLDRTKIFAQAIIGEPIDIGAELDTKVANFATMLSRAESLQEVTDILSMLGKETKQGLKSSLEGIRDNAGYNGVIREAADEILKMDYLWSESKLPENTKDYFNASHSVEPTNVNSLAEDSKHEQKPVEPEEESEGDVEAVWRDAKTGKPADIKEPEEVWSISDTIKVAYDGDAEGFSLFTVYDLDAGKAYKVELPDDTEITHKDLYEMFKNGELEVLKEFDLVQ